MSHILDMLFNFVLNYMLLFQSNMQGYQLLQLNMYNHQYFTFLLWDGADRSQAVEITTRDGDSNRCTSCWENPRYMTYTHCW
jgi:hypothetical protein